MKKHIHSLLISSALLFAGCEVADYSPASSMAKDFADFLPEGTQVKGDTVETKGIAQEAILSEADNASPTQVSHITSKAGERNYWHVHPGGEIIIVTNGEGYYQEKGSAKKLLKKGDVVRCMPGLIHWHGATNESGFSYISISNNTQHGITEWHEEVSAIEYSAPLPPKGNILK